ncbi:MAG TPA: VWA domain-containing protein [Thermoanaerobaculia bacterium]|nr:VWA domain-containing protein [Thermoanaerobaculia bacterium]
MKIARRVLVVCAGLVVAASGVGMTAGAGDEARRPPLAGGFGRPAQAPTPPAAPPGVPPILPPLVPTPTPTPRALPLPSPPPAPPAPTQGPAPTATPPAAPPLPTAAPPPPPTAVPPTPAPMRATPSLSPRQTPSAPKAIASIGLKEEPSRTSAAVSVGYVMVPFVVTDLKGRPVGDLRQKDVTLLSDGEPVATDIFAKSDDAPVSFTILLDVSGSMGLGGKMEGAREAIAALLNHRRKGDDFALYTFGGGEFREAVPFTEKTLPILSALSVIKPYGKTAFYDALSRIGDRTLMGKNGSRALILLTDGLDNASRLTRDDLEKLLQDVDLPVYPLGLRAEGALTNLQPGQNPEAMLNLEILGNVARMSGGKLAIVDDPGKLDQAIIDVERDLRAQYLLGFAPTGAGPVRFHRLTLRVSGPARPLRVRAGYRGTDPPKKSDRTGSNSPELETKRST